MEEDRPGPELYARGRDAFRDHKIHGGVSAAEQNLYAMITSLAAQIETLVARIDELETAARDAGGGENAINTEVPRTLPHQP